MLALILSEAANLQKPANPSNLARIERTWNKRPACAHLIALANLDWGCALVEQFRYASRKG